MVFQVRAQDILIRQAGYCSPSGSSQFSDILAWHSINNIYALIKFHVRLVVPVSVLQDRSLDEDLRSMMCADALATAKSTLAFLSAYHTVAPTVYTAVTCDVYYKDYVPIDRPGVEVRDPGHGS